MGSARVDDGFLNKNILNELNENILRKCFQKELSESAFGAAFRRL